MLDHLLSLFAPHLCCGCGEIGSVLCNNCKYNIISEPFTKCIQCSSLTSTGSCCEACRSLYVGAWCVGERTGVLQHVVDQLKFQRMKAAHLPLADMLASVIDQLPPETVVVPVPTISRHVRERGYDQVRLIAQRLAKRRGWRMQPLVKRRTQTMQRGVNAQQRIAQAKQAFTVPSPLDVSLPYLLIDDVVTTGATVRYAAEALKRAGAKRVYVAVIARQALD